MPEDAVAWSDRKAIGTKSDLSHPEFYEVVDQRSMSFTMFMQMHETLFGDIAVLQSLQMFLALTLKRRFATEASIHELNQLSFYRDSGRIDQYKSIIGYTMEMLPPFQLPLFFALLLKWTTFEEVTRNSESRVETPENEQFMQQSIQWPSGRRSIEFYPQIAAPNSVAHYVSKQLGLQNNKSIKRMDHEGYQSPRQISAAMKGYFKLYTEPRYTMHFTHILFISCLSRWTPLCERKERTKHGRGTPVFDITADKVQTVLNQESRHKVHVWYYNGGFAPAVIREANLGIENRNRMLNRFRFHQKPQTLPKLYERLWLFSVKSNRETMVFWLPEITQKYPRLAEEMRTELESLMSLDALNELKGLFPKIKISKEDRLKDTLRRLSEDQLKFTFKHERWSVAQDIQLGRIVTERSSSDSDNEWELNENELAAIVTRMNAKNNRWSAYKITCKLREMGIDLVS